MSLAEGALKDLKARRKYGPEFPMQRWVLEEAIEALEKQVPKLVEVKEWSPSVCPTCREELSTHQGDGYYSHSTHLERCINPDCAQRIKWR